jgi:hypothetical protein
MTIDRERLHATFDVLLTIFAVLVLPSVLLEALAPADDPAWALAVDGLDGFIWVGFALSVLAAVIVAPDRSRAMRSHALVSDDRRNLPLVRCPTASTSAFPALA